MSFFRAIISFGDMVNFVFNIRSELRTSEIFEYENLIQKRKSVLPMDV